MKKTTPWTRRDVLKAGAAAGLALPFLSSKVAMGQTAKAPVRVLIVALQHGWGFDRSIVQTFSGTENNFTLLNHAATLNPIKDQMVFVDGLRSTQWGNNHDMAYTDILTSSVRGYGNTGFQGNSPVLGGPFPPPSLPSIDWSIGNAVKKQVLRLNLNYSSFSAPFHPLSFDDSLRLLPYYTSAQSAYQAIVDPLRSLPVTNPGSPQAQQAMVGLLGKHSNRLLGMLTGTERTKMEGYIASLNSLGKKLLNPPLSFGNLALPPTPGPNPTFTAELDAHLELIRIAFTADTHRVAVLGIGDLRQSDWSWTDSQGVPRNGNTSQKDFHHGVAHWNGPEGIINAGDAGKCFGGWAAWHMRKMIELVNKLKATVDVDGKSLLENTIIVLAGEVGDGNHNHTAMVFPIIGGGGGVIRRNRWINLPIQQRSGQVQWRELNVDGTISGYTDVYGSSVALHHYADLWVSIARLAGLNVNTWGLAVNNLSPIDLT